MIEIPEATTLARQIREDLAGRRVVTVTAGAAPHKFAWYHGDPAGYAPLLEGDTVVSAAAHGGMVEVHTQRALLLFHDGVNLRLHPAAGPVPGKHQLLLTFEDDSALSASVQMYGGLYAWDRRETFDNPYYRTALEKPSPLEPEQFTQDYFMQLLASPDVQKLSAKAALATEQRIPGLGNGVLQDILWQARLSPRRKISTLTEEDAQALYTSLTGTLSEMSRLRGRDTEKDLHGIPGGYRSVMSAKNAGAPCPACGRAIVKEAYMGGSVYTCPNCQP